MRRATHLVQTGRPADRYKDDCDVREAASFLLCIRRCRTDEHHETVREASKGLYEGWRIWSAGQSWTRMELEARLLANENYESIAAKSGLPPSAISWYERTFYNIADRRACMSWVLNYAIGPKIHGRLTEADFGLWVRLLGFQLGPLAVDELLGTGVRIRQPTRPEEVREILSEDTRKTILHKAALAVRMVSFDDPQSAVGLCKAWALLQETEARQRASQTEHSSLLPNLKFAFGEIAAALRPADVPQQSDKHVEADLSLAIQS